ncbi:MAG TPA: symporter, partial [Microscillaceae bacterium]|nr:symporter [Microscillaceae bacterium]
FIVGAFADNVNTFVKYLYYFLLLVLAHNLVALATGAFTARIFKVPGRDLRTITIETGIQNGSTSVLLTLTFFGGVGGMALIVGWWAIWDMCSSLLLAFYWSKRPVKGTKKAQEA